MPEDDINNPCGMQEAEDLELRGEIIQECLQCKDDDCQVRKITLKDLLEHIV